MNIDSLVSFDIFDTVLIRRCGKPDNIIVLLSLYLFPNDRAKQEAFIVWRRNCTGFTIEDFYSKANAISFLPYNYLELIDAELHIEEMQLVANLKVKKLIEEYRAKGNVIKFISDMYLPSDFLEFILRREGCFVDGDEVIVSCEWKARKENGSLFKMVRNTYNPKKWTHYGDNKNSDIRMAKRFGIKAVHVDCNYTVIEQNWIDHSFDYLEGWLLSVFAGICRASRLTTDSNLAFQMTVDYILPLYYSYILSVFDNARQRGIKRLYFSSFDNKFLKRIADYIPHDDLDLRTISISYDTLILPFLRITGADGYMLLAEKNTIIGREVNDLLKEIKITPEELAQHNIEINFSKIETKEQETYFVDALFNNQSLLDWMRKRSDADLQMIKEYFIQEGLMDGKHSAMVDIGWNSSMRVMVNALLKYFNANFLEFYYISVSRDALPPVYGDYIPFFKVSNISQNVIMFIDEYYKSSYWTVVDKYRRNDDGVIVPVFKANASLEIINIHNSFMDAIDCAVPQFLEYYCNPSLLFFWAKNTIDSFLKNVCKDGMVLITRYMNLENSDLIRKLSFVEVLQVLFTGKKITRIPLLSLYITLGCKLTMALKWQYNLSSKIRELVNKRLN